MDMNIYTLSHFENGHDVTAYLMLGRTESFCEILALNYAPGAAAPGTAAPGTAAPGA